MSSIQDAFTYMKGKVADLTDWSHKQTGITLAAMMVSMWDAKDARLGEVASRMPLIGKEESLVQRMRRWLKNPLIDVDTVHEPIASKVLEGLKQTHIRLQLDRVQLGNQHNVLVVSVYWRKRALPIAWQMLPQMGNSDLDQRRALLTHVATLMPTAADVRVLADREFGDAGTLRLIEHELEWDYIIRIKSDQQICDPRDGFTLDWHTLGDLVPEVGQAPRSLSQVKFTQSQMYSANFVLSQTDPATGQATDSPWIVATNLSPTDRILHEYGKRFGCEALFSDLKSRGFDWEQTQLRHADRLSRLLLVLALLTVWMITLGRELRVSGRASEYWQPSHLNRYSLFQIGLRWLHRQLALGRPFDPHPDFQLWQFAQR
jgi:hypothetical protein